MGGITYHLQAALKAFLANKPILCDKKVRFAVRFRFRAIAPLALFAAGHRTIRMDNLHNCTFLFFRKILRMIVGPPNFWNVTRLSIIYCIIGKVRQQHSHSNMDCELGQNNATNTIGN